MVGFVSRPKSSRTTRGTIISAANDRWEALSTPSVQNSSLGSAPRPSVLRTIWAAFMISWSARNDRNWMASNTFDFPTPFGPAMHAKGSKLTSRPSRFLNPSTSRRVSIDVAEPNTSVGRRPPGEGALALGALPRVEQHPLVVPPQEVAVVVPMPRRHGARRPQHHQLAHAVHRNGVCQAHTVTQGRTYGLRAWARAGVRSRAPLERPRGVADVRFDGS